MVANRLPAVLVVIAMFLFAAPVAVQAQNQDGSIIDASNNTLWLHIKNSPRTYWSNSIQTDPAHDSTGSGYNALGFVLTEPGVAAWSLPMTPALTTLAQLDPAGKVNSTIYIGGTSAAGRVTVTSELRLGSTLVATGTSAAVVWANEYIKVEISSAPSITTLNPAAGNLVWTIKASGMGAQIFVGAGGTTWSRMALPVLGQASSPAPALLETFENITSPSVELFVNKTNVSFEVQHYNWTTSLTALQLTHNVPNHHSGEVNIRIKDGANRTVASHNWTSPAGNGTAGNATSGGNATSPRTYRIDNASAGNWTLELALTGFKGTFTLSLGAVPANPGAPSSGSNGTTNPNAGTNANQSGTNGTGDPGAGAGKADNVADKSTPSAGMLFAAAALATAFIIRRRRLT